MADVRPVTDSPAAKDDNRRCHAAIMALQRWAKGRSLEGILVVATERGNGEGFFDWEAVQSSGYKVIGIAEVAKAEMMEALREDVFPPDYEG